MSSTKPTVEARPRNRRLILIVVAAAVLLALAFGAWRIWDGHHVQPSEARNALLRLPYDLRFRSIPKPEGLSTAIAGTARAKDGTRVNFLVLIGRAGEDSPEVPVVPGAGTQTASRSANATVIVDTPRAKPDGLSEEEVAMDLAIEDAIYDQAPLVPREG
jgi:hypothetical protein